MPGLTKFLRHFLLSKPPPSPHPENLLRKPFSFLSYYCSTRYLFYLLNITHSNNLGHAHLLPESWILYVTDCVHALALAMLMQCIRHKPGRIFAKRMSDIF